MAVPEISVLMCTYNSAKYIVETIESILNQTFTDYEFIIVDDCSTDNTGQIVKQFNDKRIKYYRLNENIGIGRASNFGLSKVSGKYLARADSDDIYDRTRLEKQKMYLDEFSECTVVGTLVDYFTDELVGSRYQSFSDYIEKQVNSVIDYKDIHEKLYWFCCMINSSIMGRIEMIKKFGYDRARIGEDYKMFYDMNVAGYKMGKVEEKLCKVRIRGNSITATRISNVCQRIFEIKEREIADFFFHDSRKIYIWGTGGLGQSLYQIFEEKRYIVDGFFDGVSERCGKTLFGKLIESPYEIITNEKKFKVCVASDPGRFEITDFLKKNGYEFIKDYIVF